MSQIGYMIMGVSVGAYTAGLFHLMTHAFFKALLFMAAGSVIGAMGGNQSLDRMSGLRRALPFTFICFVIGGLALSGVPPFSGYFSKDAILLFVAGRGGWHWALWAAGYGGRAADRALHVPDDLPRVPRRAVPGGARADRARPPLPSRAADQPGERRDRGHRRRLPRPRARDRRAGAADARGDGACSPLLAVVGGIVAIPKVDELARQLPRADVPDSTLVGNASDGVLALGLILGAVVSLGGIALAYYVWVVRPSLARARSRARFAPLTSLFEHKWYFDELIDALVVTPAAWFGRFAQNTFERRRRQRHPDRRDDRGSCARARRSCAATQSGFVRALRGADGRRHRRRRPLLPDPGLRPRVLSILIWLPAAAALIGAIAGGERVSGGLTLLGSLGSLALAIALIAGYNGNAGELTHVTDDVWIRSLGIHYDIGVNGLNLFLVAMTTLVFALSLLAANLRSWPKPTMFYLLSGVAESAVLGAFLAQDLILFVAFFDLMLIPFYLLTGIWGGPGRVAATTKLVIYTLVGSLLMLAGAVALARADRAPGQRPADRLQPTRRCRRRRSAGRRRTGSSCCSPPRSSSRCPPSRCTAGCPTPIARCRSRCSRCSAACCRRSAPTASSGSCCRCCRAPASTSRR